MGNPAGYCMGPLRPAPFGHFMALAALMSAVGLGGFILSGVLREGREDRARLDTLERVLGRVGHGHVSIAAAPPLGTADDRVAVVLRADRTSPGRTLRQALDDLGDELAAAAEGW